MLHSYLPSSIHPLRVETGGRSVMVGTNGALALLGIWPVSVDASATTGVMKAQAAKENPKGQAQAAKP